MNKIKDAFYYIKASDEFKAETIKKLQAQTRKSEISRKKSYYRPMVAVATILVVAIGVMSFRAVSNTNTSKNEIATSTNTVNIPKIELSASGGKNGKMMPLIVYKGKVYTLSTSTISSEKAEKLVGEKLGTTKEGIDEWSKQTDYATEFASTVGIQDVYAVKGYDKTFRIMTNMKNEDGTTYPQFYEALNGLTVKTGKDVFGKLKLDNNISDAKYRSFSDWSNGVEKFSSVKDVKIANVFAKELDNATPYLLEDIEAKLGDYQNDENYRELTLSLKDGSTVTLSVLKSGYVYYGSQKIFFKVNDKAFEKLWNALSI